VVTNARHAEKIHTYLGTYLVMNYILITYCNYNYNLYLAPSN